MAEMNILDKLEEILVKTTDQIAPIKEYSNNMTTKSQITPTVIKRKISQRQRLVARLKQNPTVELKGRVKNLNIV